MLKKIIIIIILIVLGLMFISCGGLMYGVFRVQDEIHEISSERKSERERRKVTKKDGPDAFENEKYSEGIKEVIKDIMKRPINKEVEFKGMTLLIPENTKLNLKLGNIVDEKTGYGISIRFEITNYCTKYAYRKKIRDTEYVTIFWNEQDPELNSINIILEKIAKTNGFTKTCK